MNNSVQLLPLEESDREQFIADNQEAFNYGAMENVHKITDWVHTHLNEDGQIKEVTHSAYGRILWDVRNKTVRPNYRTVINDSMAK